MGYKGLSKTTLSDFLTTFLLGGLIQPLMCAIFIIINRKPRLHHNNMNEKNNNMPPVGHYFMFVILYSMFINFIGFISTGSKITKFNIHMYGYVYVSYIINLIIIIVILKYSSYRERLSSYFCKTIKIQCIKIHPYVVPHPTSSNLYYSSLIHNTLDSIPIDVDSVCGSSICGSSISDVSFEHDIKRNIFYTSYNTSDTNDST
jgi:uncharacterized membrane protein YcgQ (UPF0703/DUF1980 family)